MKRFARSNIMVSLIAVLAMVLALGPGISKSEAASLTAIDSRGATASAGFALANSATPMPSTAGTNGLFVDGSFYSQAGANVHSYLLAQALSGLPIVMVGPGLDQLLTELGIKGREIQYEVIRGVKVPVPIEATALRILPQRLPDGSLVPAIDQVMGDANHPDSKLVPTVSAWITETSSITQASAPLSASLAATMGISSVSAADAPYWAITATYQLDTGDLYSPHGRFGTNTIIWRLENDNDPNHDYRSVEVIQDINSGRYLYGSTWNNSMMRVWCDLTAYQSDALLLKWGPTTTGGSSTTGVTIGLNDVSLSWSYSTTDVTVKDKSVLGSQHFEIQHNISRNSSCGKNSYEAEPGFTFRVNEGTASFMVWKQAQWAKYQIAGFWSLYDSAQFPVYCYQV